MVGPVEARLHERGCMGRTSRISGLYKLPPERQQIVADWARLTPEQAAALEGALSLAQADKMVENAIGVLRAAVGRRHQFPSSTARDVPGADGHRGAVGGGRRQHAAKLARAGGGFHAESTEPLMIGQIQVLDVAIRPARWQQVIGRRSSESDRSGQRRDPDDRGAARRRRAGTSRCAIARRGPMLVVHSLYDCRDAMGANTGQHGVRGGWRPMVEELTGGRVGPADPVEPGRPAAAHATRCDPGAALGVRQRRTGRHVPRARIVEASSFAELDPYRAATHNKGIMNGIDAVAIATGNDWRAIEAGAHAYAARDGRLRSLSDWSLTPTATSLGSLELPLAVGTVGGATRVHPTARRRAARSWA